jgi:hypothetical protein
MLIVDGQIHLWEKGTPAPPHRQEPYSAPRWIKPVWDWALIPWGVSISTTRRAATSLAPHWNRKPYFATAYCVFL